MSAINVPFGSERRKVDLLKVDKTACVLVLLKKCQGKTLVGWLHCAEIYMLHCICDFGKESKSRSRVRSQGLTWKGRAKGHLQLHGISGHTLCHCRHSDAGIIQPLQKSNHWSNWNRLAVSKHNNMALFWELTLHSAASNDLETAEREKSWSFHILLSFYFLNKYEAIKPRDKDDRT